MSRFKTLLQREWMQHHRGWLILPMTPPLLILAAMFFLPSGHVQPNEPALVMVASTFAVMSLVMFVAGVALVFQAAGLTRRDEQDRSIEFWLSQPVSHTASVGATVLMHLVFVPLLALAIGYAASQLIGMLVVLMTHGVAGWASLPLGGMFVGSFATFLRIAFGLVLALAWVMPLLLLIMVATGWLKGWGVPALVALLVTAHLVGKYVYDVNWVADALGALRHGAAYSLLHIDHPNDEKAMMALVHRSPWPLDTPWLLRDAWRSITELAQPAFVLSVLSSAACFAALVWRRSRVS